ncbi:TPA: glycosyltransferase [Vibrio parahaemolyticus]|uniref:glycosyltransferase n=1 Tax=Vibrio TaxID=662 RepID=UPI00112456E0|nr:MULTISPECIES: glycosyltransferase [Vibrio]EHR5462514.1 glycosyltransferase [Vibrio parahaemolyticus]EIO2934322.1 glycosyltransferase [Vibrio parahaemolyticus]EJE4224991.1 glycosyltransferase [Vibrio parahaemolyticus]MBO0243899.1 glycosyltransferase [Vibrio sp. Vb0592]MDF4695143.1 glycosyltransferase [Vibrio parahaemolyticus]
MKVLLVITGLGVGGAEKQVCDLADTYSTFGHDVTILSMHGEPLLKPQSTSVEVLSLRMEKSLLGVASTYLKIKKIIKSFAPDIVHSHMVHANILMRLVRVTTPIKRLICTAHSSNEGGRLRMLAYKLTQKQGDLLTNVSEEAVEAFIDKGACSSDRIIALHNGIDLNKYRFNKETRFAYRSEIGVNEDETLLLSVGRLTEAKDYPNLLNAFSSLLLTERKVKLAIIGDGDKRQELKILAEELGIEDKVNFIGLSHQVPQWMSAADIFVLSSAWEGFGLVVAEAMAAERVIVATDCGGVGEVVSKYGFLVPPRDSQALSGAIKQALDMSEDEKQTLGAKAREHVEQHYSLIAISKKWLNLYQSHNK